jgi:AcrR family transcriptional regulator
MTATAPGRVLSTRDRILNAASQAFAEAGFAGARVDEIARIAGVNKALLYYHVGNKRKLYTAVLMRNFDRMETALVGALDAGGSVDERLAATIQGIMNALEELPDHPRIILREFASAGHNLEPEVLERMVRILTTVRDLLAEGARRGELRATEPVLTHLTLIGAALILNAATPLRDRLAEIEPPIGLPEPGADRGVFLADVLLNGIAVTRNGDAQ